MASLSEIVLNLFLIVCEQDDFLRNYVCFFSFLSFSSCGKDAGTQPCMSEQVEFITEWLRLEETTVHHQVHPPW